MIYGIRALVEAIRSGHEFEKVFISQDSKSNLMPELQALLRKKDISHQFVPIQKLNRLYRGTHQGAVGLIKMVKSYGLQEFLDEQLQEKTTMKLLALDRITDVRNIGALSRTALGLGYDALVVPDRGSALLHENAVKSSAGALLILPIIKVSNMQTALRDLKLYEFNICGVSEKSSVNLEDTKCHDYMVLLLGNEETGISNECMMECDQIVRIPMSSEIGSLNVSVAGAIAMYALR